MVELIVVSHSPAPGVIFNDNTIRILCGTGELKGVQAEGTATVTTVTGGVASRPLQLWGHFGQRHDNGFDFLCRDLPNHESDD